jgi:hypothetical protein
VDASQLLRSEHLYPFRTVNCNIINKIMAKVEINVMPII